MILLALLSSAFAAPSWHDLTVETSWRTEASKQHGALGEVLIQSREIDGIKCYRGKARTHLSGESLIQTVTDLNNTARWSQLSESTILSRAGNQIQFYQMLDVPDWTFASDRFWFANGGIEHTGNRWMWHWENVPSSNGFGDRYQDVIGRNPSAVEVPVNVGAWIFESGTDGQTDVIYSTCSDPGGTLPSSLQSMATRNSMPDHILGLIQEADRRY